MVHGIVSAGVATARRGAENWARTQSRRIWILCDGGIDAFCPAQSTDRRDRQSRRTRRSL
jgi:hypothetical protein